MRRNKEKRIFPFFMQYLQQIGYHVPNQNQRLVTILTTFLKPPTQNITTNRHQFHQQLPRLQNELCYGLAKSSHLHS